MTNLRELPSDLATTRIDLHRLAAYVIAPARYVATQRFGLRPLSGGFGTPEFDGRRIRVEGTELIDERGSESRSTEISTLAAAGSFLRSEIDPSTAAEGDSPALGDVDEPLRVSDTASRYLGAWFANAAAALEEVRADAASTDPSIVQLWPGHFDPAIEVGDTDRRGSYGASPGDHTIDEPYLYVSVWYPDRLDIDFADGFWNADGYSGRVLKVSDFAAGVDEVEIASQFWVSTRDRLR